MKKNIFLSVLFFFVAFAGFSQQQHDFGFEKNFDVVVYHDSAQPLKLPWLGGMHMCQFNSIDLNFDGVKDLVVFDRVGNRLMTFLNNGTPNTVDYVYAPEYEEAFPYMYDWVFLRDYNNNGKEDIFTYFTAGMSVYRNDSDPVNGLKFTKVTTMLNSLQYANYLNLFVSDVELPGFGDIDGDGCMDIMVFHILGSYINLHTSQSMKKYGHCDSLDFKRTVHCWGNIFESEDSNELTLEINCPYDYKNCDKEKEEKGGNQLLHVGSTLLPIDLTGNGLMDLIIGDTDFPNLIATFNEGSLDTANMVSQDTAFPSYDVPVHLYATPLPSLIDVNNNGLKDMLVSPNQPSLLLTQSHESVWYYKNIGSDTIPHYQLQTKEFLQGDMIDVGSGAYPVLYDFDGNGLADLFVANYGYRDSSYYFEGFLYSKFLSKISYYKNTGTASQPEFTLITDDFANLSSLNITALYPAFGDINDNGLTDIILGQNDGTLLFLENTSTSGNEPQFAPTITNYKNIDVGRFSTPQLIDLNRNGLLDLVIGNRLGLLSFYENTGTATEPEFTLVTDTLGGANASDVSFSSWGYSVPCFFEDSTGVYNLFLASESGKILYYNDIENNLNGQFNLEEEQLLLIYEGKRAGVAVKDLNNDGFVDMIIGNLSGGLNFYKGTTPNPLGINKPHISNYNINIYPNPAKDIVNIETDFPINPDFFHIEIYNITGQMIQKQAFSHTICTRNLKNGIYILRVAATGGHNYKQELNKKLVIHK